MAQVLSRVQQIDEALSNFLRPDSRGRLSPHESLWSHSVVVRPPAAFGWNPGNDLVGVGDVTGLAVNAVRGVQADAFTVGRRFVVDHLVDIRGTKILAGAAVFFHATLL